MRTSYDSYKQYICVNCKNKAKDLCEIKRKYDGTMYCSGYDTDIVKRKKTPVMWQEW